MTEATSRHVHEASTIERAPTGVGGLDLSLGGGLIRGGIYLVMGRPGTGKTTLANQLCFAHVAAGGRAAYVTLLAESHASMMKNLQTMQFFEPEAINRSLVYVGAYRALRDEKLKGLLGLLRQVIRDERASLLVLDGVSPTRALAGSDLALKEFIVELQMLGSMTDCTTLLFANMDADDANGPEHTMVDGLIELAFERTHRVTRRTLEVIKFRGSRHLLGKHELSISDAGVVIHPRTEDVIDVDARPPAPTDGRLATGLERLDAMLGGGLISNTTSVVLGFTGSGKTTLATHFLAAGAAAGESCFYFGFYESPARLLEQGDAIGLELSRHTAEGRLCALWQPPYRYGLDALAERLLGEVRRRQVKRLVIDGLDGYWQATIEPSRTIRYLTALSNELRSLGVTTIITSETSKPYGPEVAMRIEGASALVDNLLLLEYLTVGTDLRRLLSVVKQRGSWHETAMREFALTSSGLALSPDASSAEELIAGNDAALGRRNHKSRPSESELPRPPAPLIALEPASASVACPPSRLPRPLPFCPCPRTMAPPRTILVVDDEYASLEVLALLLEAEGYRVLTASDGVEALGRLGLEAADLVITDYMMPRMTGGELCRRMNAEARLRNVPVIMVTAMYRDDVPPSPQVVALFVKPLRFDKLLGAVRDLLGTPRRPEGLRSVEPSLRRGATAGFGLVGTPCGRLAGSRREACIWPASCYHAFLGPRRPSLGLLGPLDTRARAPFQRVLEQ